MLELKLLIKKSDKYVDYDSITSLNISILRRGDPYFSSTKREGNIYFPVKNNSTEANDALAPTYNTCFKKVLNILLNLKCNKWNNDSGSHTLDGNCYENNIVKEACVPALDIKIINYKEVYLYDDSCVNLSYKDNSKLYLPYIRGLRLYGSLKREISEEYFKTNTINKDSNIAINNLCLNGNFNFRNLRTYNCKLKGNYKVEENEKVIIIKSSVDINTLKAQNIYLKDLPDKYIRIKDLHIKNSITGKGLQKDFIFEIDNLFLNNPSLLFNFQGCEGKFIIHQINIKEPSIITFQSCQYITKQLESCNTGCEFVWDRTKLFLE